MPVGGSYVPVLVNEPKIDQPLTGAINGVNAVFTTPDKFVHDGSLAERFYYNGVRLKEGVGQDYEVSESGGAGTGYDTITMALAPKIGDVLTIDYFVV